MSQVNRKLKGHSGWSLAATFGLAAVLTLAACSQSTPKTAEAANPSSGGALLFSVPAQQMSHVQVVTVEPGTLRRVLRLSGAVAFNAFRTTPVITQVSGPVSRVVAQPGEVVRQHQPMLYLASPDYSQLRANYLKARDAFDLADKNYLRSKDLYAHNAVAERDLQAAESARTQAQADMVAAEQALTIIGISNPETVVSKPASPEVPLLAPIAGEVVERLVSPGQVVQAGNTQCFTISDMSTVWVLANVFQDDLAYVHVGDPVDITTSTYPGQQFRGRISYVAEGLDPASHTVQARVVTQNPGRRLKKDMYVTVTVAAGAIKNALTVPDSAVLRSAENEPFVYVSVNQAGNQFARRTVKLGESNHGATQILDGLKPGERVVGDGSLFLQFANSLQQ
ncbi:MAG TPA: efflux RND transporter periplasmic adaptor subunit [Terriglobales bacterium]|nr:efflux RND transporter periplasmic adaptor subunit [Terriglobales bacterium]